MVEWRKSTSIKSALKFLLWTRFFWMLQPEKGSIRENGCPWFSAVKSLPFCRLSLCFFSLETNDFFAALLGTRPKTEAVDFVKLVFLSSNCYHWPKYYTGQCTLLYLLLTSLLFTFWVTTWWWSVLPVVSSPRQLLWFVCTDECMIPEHVHSMWITAANPAAQAHMTGILSWVNFSLISHMLALVTNTKNNELFMFGGKKLDIWSCTMFIFKQNKLFYYRKNWMIFIVYMPDYYYTGFI